MKNHKCPVSTRCWTAVALEVNRDIQVCRPSTSPSHHHDHHHASDLWAWCCCCICHRISGNGTTKKRYANGNVPFVYTLYKNPMKPHETMTQGYVMLCTEDWVTPAGGLCRCAHWKKKPTPTGWKITSCISLTCFWAHSKYSHANIPSGGWPTHTKQSVSCCSCSKPAEVSGNNEFFLNVA